MQKIRYYPAHPRNQRSVFLFPGFVNIARELLLFLLARRSLGEGG
jgi:hypothetical protein